MAAEDGPSCSGQQPKGDTQPSAAPVEEPAEQQAGSLSPEQCQAVAFLHGMLDNINKSDTTGIFYYPVDGKVVPGYYDKIKRPMCFMVMRDKVQGRRYRTWRAFVADFELICSNARTFNPKTHRIHKMAVAMQQKGRKLMETSQFQGRRCIHLLHPEGPAVAAAEEAADLLQHKEEPATSSALGGTGAASTTTSAGPGDGAEAEAGVVNGRQHEPTAPRPPPPDEDFSAAGRLWDAAVADPGAAGGAVAWGALFREAALLAASQQQQQQQQQPVFGAPTLATPSVSASAVAAWSQRPGVVFQPYASSSAAAPAIADHASVDAAVPPATAAAAAAPSAGAADGAEHGAAAAAAAQPAPARFGPSGRTREWKAERRSVEWRARWLELRMRELKAVIGALQHAGDGSAVSSAAQAQQVPQQQQQQQQQPQLQQQGQPVQPQLQQQQRQRQPVPACWAQPDGYLLAQQLEMVEGPAIANAPFFARHGAAGVQVSQPGAAPAAPTTDNQQQQHPAGPPAAAALALAAAGTAANAAASSAAAHAPGPTPLPAPPAAPIPMHLDDCEPARVFSMLDLVERQLCDMRTRLATTFNIPEAAPAAAARFGAQNMARGGGGSGSKRAGIQRQASGRQLQRDGSIGSSMNKRRRLEDDIVVSPTAGTPHNRMLERTVSVIAIPPVRELPPAELKARSKAIAHSWRQPGTKPTKGSGIGSRGGRGGASGCRGGVSTAGSARGLSDQVPPEVAEVLAGMDEGSSSEDTSDEAFVERHKYMEEEERLRFAGQLGGARRQANKAGKQAGKNAGKAAAKPVGRPKATPAAKVAQQQGKVQQQQQQQQDAQQMPPPMQAPSQLSAGTPAAGALGVTPSAATSTAAPAAAAAAAAPGQAASEPAAAPAAAVRKSASPAPTGALTISVPAQHESAGPDSATRPSPSRSSARVAAAAAATPKGGSKASKGGATPRSSAGGAAGTKGLAAKGADTKRSGTPKGQNGSSALGAAGSTRLKSKGKR